MPLPASFVPSYGQPAVPVMVDVQGGMLLVQGPGVDRREPLAGLQRSAGSRGPLGIRFPDGAQLEVRDRAAFDQLLNSVGSRIPVSQWDSSPRPMLLPVAAVLLFFAALIYVAFRYVIPVVSGMIAEQLPASLSTTISDHTLAALDNQALTPTKLTAERQAELTSAFEQLHAPADRGRYRLFFRQSEAIGPNAMALPSGIIVITDELVTLARDDREILGVLAHEAGHVDRRHGLRLVVQSSLLSIVVAWTLGDFGSIVAAAPTELLQAKYSRDFERDADAHAVALLRRRGIRPSFLADILQRIERSAAERSGASPEPRKALVMYDYTASHPATAERLEYLRNLP
jgi:Zn-dependent protease with chaperone function